MSRALALTHRRDQASLTALLIAELRALWPGSTPPSVEVATALVAEYGSASAALAATYYEQARGAARALGQFTVPLLDPPPAEQVGASLAWATSPLRRPDPDEVLARRQAEGALRRLATNTGRDTLVHAGVVDRVRTRWARVTGPNACSFCLMLAGRGAVYLTEETARGERGGYHDYCGCVPQILFPGENWEPGEQTRQARELYNEATAGLHGADARRAFRRAVETGG